LAYLIGGCAAASRAHEECMAGWAGKALRQAGWAPASLFVLYVGAAQLLDVYTLYPWLDIPSHITGGAAIAYFSLACVRAAQASVGRIPLPVQFATALGLAAIAAIAWEVAESCMDAAFGTRLSLGADDTIHDLVFGLLGASVMIACAARFRAAQPSTARHAAAKA
jgi:hypothetical protein